MGSRLTNVMLATHAWAGPHGVEQAVYLEIKHLEKLCANGIEV